MNTVSAILLGALCSIITITTMIYAMKRDNLVMIHESLTVTCLAIVPEQDRDDPNECARFEYQGQVYESE